MDIPAGHWRGTVDTWLDPSAPPANNPIAATTAHLVDGKTVQVEYRSHVGEHRSDGIMILGIDIATNRPCLTWIDTFHTGANVMLFAAGENGDFHGAYAAGAEIWRWRVVVRAAADELHFAHFNISPDGQEDRAIEVTLRPA
jgi:hypothetical protein